MNIRPIFAAVLFLISSEALLSQNPSKFKKEVDSLVALNKTLAGPEPIVFTGSSSIRLWKDLKATFPGHNVLNLGFGGSEMSDLQYYADQLILSFKPKQIFIYEGDNDINSGRSSEQIISSATDILARIRQQLPTTEVIFISPKPSIRRWALRDKYIAFNKQFRDWVEKQQGTRYADVWMPMVDDKGVVLQDIFVEDNLHLNKKGYTIWANVLKRYLK
jgi:lysophospholipase L1-like esterase